MKIIVSGGAGFIGSNLVEKLAKGNNEIVVIDNFSTGRMENLLNFKKKIKIVKADISKKGKWEKNFKNAYGIYHLAARADIVPSIKNPNIYFEANVQGTKNIMEAARKYNLKKVVYTASSSCYGIPKKFPTKENEKISLVYPYALTKYLGEQIVLHWGKVYKIKAISLRLFNVYGLRSRTSGTYGAVFGVFLAQKIAKKPLTVVGDGNQTRDFTFVTDVVNALIKSFNSKISNEIINIGSDKTQSINKIVKLLKCEKVHIPKRPGEPDCTWADITKAKKLLLWKPKINLEKGIEIIIKNIDYWKKAPIWSPKKISHATKDWFKLLK